MATEGGKLTRFQYRVGGRAQCTLQDGLPLGTSRNLWPQQEENSPGFNTAWGRAQCTLQDGLPLGTRNLSLQKEANLAFTRYCHHQYFMVYGIHRRGRWGGVYCAMGVQ